MTDTTSLEGLNILAVEDEMLVAMMLEDILAEAGCEVAVAGHLEQAVTLATEGAFDAAVLDENLNGKNSYPVAAALRARGIPFLFATGFGDTNLRKHYPDQPVLTKPYRDRDLIAALTAIVSGSCGAR